MWRTRSLFNREQRNTSSPAEGGAIPDHALTDHTDVTITAPALGQILYYNGTEWVNSSPTSLSHPIAAHGKVGSPYTLTAGASNTWYSVTWPTSVITDVTVCPLSFFAAGGSVFTIPEDGYYNVAIDLALAADPDLTNATLDFGLYVNGSLYRTFPVSSNDWSLNYSAVPNLFSAGDTLELKYRRVGSGYATAVDMSNIANMTVHKIASVGYGGATAHALNNHTDTNFPSPTNGQVVTWDAGSGEWIASTPTVVAHSFGSHTDANANLTSPGAGKDQWVIVWDNASSSYKLVVNPALGSHALNSHTDTNLGSPGAGQQGYVISWDNGSGKYVLTAPSAPGAHTLGSHSDVTLTSPTNGQYLVYNAGTGKWVNQSLSVAMNLDDLSNVNTTGKANRDIIWWDSGTGKWVKRTLLLGDISNVNTAGADRKSVV